MRPASDDASEILNGLVAGDRAAFEVVYRRHNPAMLRLATAILHSRASAEEVVQDTWVSVLRHIGGFEGRSTLAGWIFTILTNKARTRAARDGRSVSFDTDGEDDTLAAAFDGRGRWRDMPELWDEVTPERVVEGRNILDHVTRAIEALPPAQRAVMILRGQQGLEPAEVCTMLGITEGNMRVLLHRARFALRGELARLLT
ncbi:MAG TPA: sigma-70 family RNA polymerase sigma factor [Paracoccaceae bacterium]